MGITKCPNCNNPVSKKWLLFSSFKTYYKCPQCGSNISWNMYRYVNLLVSVLIGVVGSRFLVTFFGDKISIFLESIFKNNIIPRIIFFSMPIIITPLVYILMCKFIPCHFADNTNKIIKNDE